MRSLLGSAIVGLGALACAGLCLGQTVTSSAPAPVMLKWVTLNGPADLERLRVTNPNHYLRARKIIAAANEICQPGAGQPSPARFAGDSVDCRSMFWMTSLPPKKQLSFLLDDVGYIALVSVTVVGDKFIDGPAQATPILKRGPNH